MRGSVGWGQRARLQQLEAAVIARPFDLDRHAKHSLGLAEHAAERNGFAGVEARLVDKLARHCLRGNSGAAVCVPVRPMATDVGVVLAAGFVGPQEALTREHDAVRHHLALSNRRAQPPGGAEQHLAFGVFA
jgi:hypothetical protein